MTTKIPLRKMLIKGFYCERCYNNTFLSTLCSKCKEEIEQDLYNIAKDLIKKD